ncbi:hypothetical protein E2C01_050410 [Portunus trituberculatus]|uniref:Uncharacterized protein n=1 Tax=Portunus trituberculatus TaxID=210409 RepID=A0A5B7GG21_PORTR|nr:hypothetical protein [Portunus trituberculatus]
MCAALGKEPTIRGVRNRGLPGTCCSRRSTAYVMPSSPRERRISPESSKECFQPYSTALGVQSNSPLKRNLDRAVTWIAESGMPYQWVRETLMIVRKDRKATSDVTVNIISSESGSRISFSMEHLQGVFIMFGVGCGLSFLVFLTEIPFYQ